MRQEHAQAAGGTGEPLQGDGESERPPGRMRPLPTEPL